MKTAIAVPRWNQMAILIALSAVSPKILIAVSITKPSELTGSHSSNACIIASINSWNISK